MANTITPPLTASDQMQANYEKYKDKFVDANDELVSSETFLNLLVAEMTNQDPMEPTSNTEFVTQMAQFTSLQYSKDAAAFSKSNFASNLIGKTVTAQKMEGKNAVQKTGVVDSVMKDGDSYTVRIDGVSFDISKIISISDNGGSSTPAAGSSSLGELIARASMMIGMCATVNPEVEGGSLLDSGLITSIQVKDGQVRVIINDKGYALEDIIEVAYPTIEETPEAPAEDNTENSDKESVEDKLIERAQEMASQNVEELMEVIDRMNDRQDEEVQEVIGEAAADEIVSEDIPDLEDFA